MSFFGNKIGNTKRNFKAYFALSMSFILVFTFLRFYDFANVYSHSTKLMSVGDLFNVLGLDFMLAMAFSGLGFVLYFILTFLSFRLAKYTLSILFSIIIVSYIAFIQYFNQALVPLDQVVFIYDFSDIVDIALGSGSINAFEIFTFIASLVAFFIANTIFNKIRISRYLIGLFIFLIIGSAAATNVFILSAKKFNSELAYYCNANKFIYFVKAVSKYSKSDDEIDLKQIIKYTRNYRDLDNTNKNYGPLTYPFLFQNSYESTLSNYFEPLADNEKPNIVFIVVESLSPTVSGKYSPNHSFTPFLDSLAEQSLYWRNCLSTSERTFGVLPALLSSLIPGKKGYMAEKRPYDFFMALPKLLKKNGYSTQMFYGGWAGFTHMDNFVNAAGVDSIYNKFLDYDKMPESATGHTWGYGDNVLFKATDKYIDSDTSYFSLYLTLSTHSPFVSTEPEYMKSKTDSIIETIDDEYTRNKCRKHRRQLKSFVVLDNEIRLLIDRYKKRPEYKKTIFVITGDHKGILFNEKNSIDKYYVPLIIYSPMLSQPQEFGGLVTHNDVFPSLQNLLKNNYGLNVNRMEHSLGRQLDTSIAFHANNIMFPMRNSREIKQYINGKYYLNNGKLYLISDTMEIKAVNNDDVRNRMEKELENYNKLQINTLLSKKLVSPAELMGDDY